MRAWKWIPDKLFSEEDQGQHKTDYKAKVEVRSRRDL